MSVIVELTDEDYARISFERFLTSNKKSTDKCADGTYYHRDIQNYWVVYQVAFRAGRKSVDGTCDF